MPFNLGGPELAILLVIVLVVFGAGKLPEIGGAVGKSIREFRTSVKENEAEKSATSTTAPVKEAAVTTPKSNDTTNI